MRILLVSDVHLDAPFVWAGPAVSRKRRQALRDAFVSAIDLALNERVDAVLCGGDLFEHDRVSADTGRFLQAQFSGCRRFPYSSRQEITTGLGFESLYRRIEWSPNVYVFREPQLTPVDLLDGLTLWGAAHMGPSGTGNFLDGFRVSRGGVHLALFHGSELAVFVQEDRQKTPHAPFSAADIERSGLHFAFLGHHHTPSDAARFTYPGNPEPLTFGETGTRGAVLATIGDDGVVNVDRRVIAITEVHDVEIDVTGCTNTQDVRDRVTEALHATAGYARVTLIGELAPQIALQPRT